MIEPPATHAFDGDDGTRLTYRTLGTGRPTVLLHGYMSPAVPTWVDSGIAARLAAKGRRVILPRGMLRLVPGDHDTALFSPALADELLRFLTPVPAG